MKVCTCILYRLPLIRRFADTQASDFRDKPTSPRGISAEDAIKRLQASPNSFNHRMLAALAKQKFEELDVDKQGVLPMEALMQVATLVLPGYHPGGMVAPPEDDQRTLHDLQEALRLNNEPMVRLLIKSSWLNN